MTDVALVFHRWMRENDCEWSRCVAPPEPRGPSYGTQPNVCMGDCGAIVTDEELYRFEKKVVTAGDRDNRHAVIDRLELDLVWLAKQTGVL